MNCHIHQIGIFMKKVQCFEMGKFFAWPVPFGIVMSDDGSLSL